MNYIEKEADDNFTRTVISAFGSLNRFQLRKIARKFNIDTIAIRAIIIPNHLVMVLNAYNYIPRDFSLGSFNELIGILSEYNYIIAVKRFKKLENIMILTRPSFLKEHYLYNTLYDQFEDVNNRFEQSLSETTLLNDQNISLTHQKRELEHRLQDLQYKFQNLQQNYQELQQQMAYYRSPHL